MKKLFILLLLITPLVSNAQVEKGMILLSGNISYQKNADNGAINASVPDVTQIQFTPYVGYMVSPRIALGLSANYSMLKYEYTGSSKTSNSSFAAGPFIRYYQPITEKFFFFAQGDVMFGKITNDALDPTTGLKTTNDATSTAIALRPGLVYFVSKHFAFEVMLGSLTYSRRDYKSGGSSNDSNAFGVNFITRGLSPGVLFTF